MGQCDLDGAEEVEKEGEYEDLQSFDDVRGDLIPVTALCNIVLPRLLYSVNIFMIKVVYIYIYLYKLRFCADIYYATVYNVAFYIL